MISIIQNKKCFLALVLFGATAMADPLMDFTMINPPEAAQRKIVEPVVRWLIRSSPDSFCSSASPKDGLARRPEGCVYWHQASAGCTIVTTSNTSHSQLGHLFLHCLQGR